jgi:uncharacterized membrane protein
MAAAGIAPSHWRARPARQEVPRMTTVRTRTYFDAPIERVFELGIDFQRYPEWNVSFPEVLEITGPTNKVGTKIRSVTKILGRRMEGWAEIVEIDQPRYLKMTGSALEGGKLTLTYRLTPKGSGTDLEFVSEYELPAGFLGHIADRLFVEKAVERDLRHSIENFKALVETKQPVLV